MEFNSAPQNGDSRPPAPVGEQNGNTSKSEMTPTTTPVETVLPSNPSPVPSPPSIPCISPTRPILSVHRSPSVTTSSIITSSKVLSTPVYNSYIGGGYSTTHRSNISNSIYNNTGNVHSMISSPVVYPKTYSNMIPSTFSTVRRTTGSTPINTFVHNASFNEQSCAMGTTMTNERTNALQISNQISGQTNRVVSGGQHRVIGTNTYVDESRSHVVSERVTEHEVRVPKKVVREEVIERVIIVPERIIREEHMDEIVKVRKRVIEVSKPVIQETVVEVPEIEYIERIVEYPEVVLQEKIQEVPRIEYQERIVEVPRFIQQERIVEVPEIEYVEVPFEKIVEVPEIREQVVLKQIPVPQYVEKSYPEYVNVEVTTDVLRNIPVPVEAIVKLELHFPKIRPRYNKVDVPLYVPRFVEVAVPIEVMDEQMFANAEQYAQQVSSLASQSAASLCELEKLGGSLKNVDLESFMNAFKATQEMCNFFSHSWTTGKLSVANATQLNSSVMTGHSTMTAHSSAGFNSAPFNSTGVQLIGADSLAVNLDSMGSIAVNSMRSVPEVSTMMTSVGPLLQQTSIVNSLVETVVKSGPSLRKEESNNQVSSSEFLQTQSDDMIHAE